MTKSPIQESNVVFYRLLVIFVFIFFLNFFFFHSLGPVAVVLFILGSYLFLTLIFKDSLVAKNTRLFALCVLTAIVFFCLSLSIRANGIMQSAMRLIGFATLLIYAYILSSKIAMVRSLFELILSPFYFIKTYVASAFKSIRIVASGEYKDMLPESPYGTKNHLYRSLVVGLVIGLVVVGILLSMFSSADPIFATSVKNVLSADFIQNLSQRIIWSVMIFLFLVPFLILNGKKLFNSPLMFFKRISFQNEMSIVMSLVALVMGLFLIIQWPYVFVKVPFETDLSKFGVATYSEYVRKGFIELLKVALFVYGLIWAGLVIVRENRQKGKSILKYVQIVVLLEFTLFLFSIFRRVWLYQEYHGWSMIRIYGSFFLFWVLGITVFLGLRHFWQRKWVVGEMIFTAALISVVGLLNVDSFIVNSHPPTVNGKVDYVYLSRLSADGYTGWQKAYDYQKKIIEKYEKNTFFNREERKEIAYAGIVIRELLIDYKELILRYGTQADLKQFLLDIYAFQREANRDLNVPSERRDLVTTENNNIEEMRKRIEEGKIDYRKMVDLITISDSPYKYRFDYLDADAFRWNRSFFELPYGSDYLYEQIKTDKKLEDSNLDRLYSWNASGVAAFEKMNKNISYRELLRLQEKYFNEYFIIQTQLPDERSYDMDISLNSPFLD